MTLHFISGLPRSGSTLLAAILRQNPQLHTSISSPLCDIMTGLIRSMSNAGEFSVFISDQQRERVLKSAVHAFYEHLGSDRIIFDTNRQWCGLLPGVAALFPTARVIACVRSPAWILDSVERHAQRNILTPSRMLEYDVGSNIYQRAERLSKVFIGVPMGHLRQAWSGGFADRLIVVRYEALAKEPHRVISGLYRFLNLVPFEHDFEHLDYHEPEFDARLGFKGFHSVSGRVEYVARESILPSDLFTTYDQRFWEKEGQNTRQVTIL